MKCEQIIVVATDRLGRTLTVLYGITHFDQPRDARAPTVFEWRITPEHLQPEGFDRLNDLTHWEDLRREGIRWAHGWDDGAVLALLAAAALADT